MGAYYDEIEIEDMTWDEIKGVYHYPCPCGDRFEITRKQLANYEEIATCPSCSLIIRVIFDPVRLSLAGPDARFNWYFTLSSSTSKMTCLTMSQVLRKAIVMSQRRGMMTTSRMRLTT